MDEPLVAALHRLDAQYSSLEELESVLKDALDKLKRDEQCLVQGILHAEGTKVPSTTARASTSERVKTTVAAVARVADNGNNETEAEARLRQVLMASDDDTDESD